jgi:hypothetical protein
VFTAYAMFRLALQRSQRVVPFAKPQLVSRLMPPNRAASSKRKVSVDSDGESSGVAATKKPKIDTSRPENTVLASNGQPTNKVLPVKIEFNPRPADTLRIAAWNVTSLASSHKKGASRPHPVWCFLTYEGPARLQVVRRGRRGRHPCPHRNEGKQTRIVLFSAS